MMRQGEAVLLLLFLLVLPGKKEVYSYVLPLPDVPSFFGTEDVNGRLAYERQLTANPRTGQIPRNIYQKELSFARLLDSQTHRYRKRNLDIRSVGPFNVGGRTRAVALDVRDENIILAGGVSGGIWKSTNGGITWTRTSHPGNRNSVSCIVQDIRHGKEDTWYHGTGELVGNSARGGGAPFRGNGIYKSTDNGESWAVIPSTASADPAFFHGQFQYISNIEINEKNTAQDELIVAAFGGILKSLDGGDTWQVELGRRLIDLPKSIDLNRVHASLFANIEKTVDGIYYAALSSHSLLDGNPSPDGGIYISPDADEWYRITPFSSGSSYLRIVMAHAPSDPRLCYFLIDTGLETNSTLFLKFTLNGFVPGGSVTGAWSKLNVPMLGGDRGDFNSQGSYNMVVKVSPTNSQTVFIGGTNLYRSTDGFTTEDNIDWIGGYDPEGEGLYANHHPDQHEIVFFPSDPDKMLSANDGGIRITQNFNADPVVWENRNNGYVTSQFYTIAWSQEADDIMVGGMQDNGTDLSFGDPQWTGLLGGDGGYAETTPGKNVWYASSQQGRTYRFIFDQEFNVRAFARIDPKGLVLETGSNYLFINPFVIDPLNYNRMFLAGGNYLYAHDNVAQIPGGTDPSNLGWVRLEESRIDYGVFSALDMAMDGETVYAGTSLGRLFKLTRANHILDRQIEDITSSAFPRESFISSISIDPVDSDHLLVVFSNYEVPSIFESHDGGHTFLDVSGNLEENVEGTGSGPSVRWAEIIPLKAGTLYFVGTSIGLYSTETTRGNVTWLKQSPDLIGSAVIPMMDYRLLDGRLAIATHGNGVFTTSIPDFEPMVATREGTDFTVHNPYPNPFRESTTIAFDIPYEGVVKVDIFSVKGEYIANILWANQSVGTGSVVWEGVNAAGVPFGNGVYLYRVNYRGQVRGGRIILNK